MVLTIQLESGIGGRQTGDPNRLASQGVRAGWAVEVAVGTAGGLHTNIGWRRSPREIERTFCGLQLQNHFFSALTIPKLYRTSVLNRRLVAATLPLRGFDSAGVGSFPGLAARYPASSFWKARLSASVQAEPLHQAVLQSPNLRP